MFNASGLCQTTCLVEETDLMVLSSNPFNQKALVKKLRGQVKDYMAYDLDFEKSLKPIRLDRGQPPLIQHMIRASQIANVGPMATVAGMVSHYVGQAMVDHQEVVVENGGDIYLKSKSDKVIAIYAGQSPFSNKVALKISHKDMPLGICTSAATVGHSLSFGKADAVVVVAKDTLLADAMATAIGNMVKDASDIRRGLEFSKTIPDILGCVIILGEDLGAYGDIELVSVDEG